MFKTLPTYWPTQRDHKEVWSIAWPMILSNITVPLVGLVDTAVIGHLPESQHLAAVAIGSMIFSIVYWAFGFLRMGTTGLTAQAVGADDDTTNRTLLAQSLVMATFIGICIILLQGPIIQLALHWIAAEPLVTEEALNYASIRIYGAPAVLCNFALLGWFVGNQNTKIPLLLLTVTNLLNMVMDIIAVYGLGMFADGVALATVIAEYGSLLLGLYLCRRVLKPMGGQLLRSSLTQIKHYTELFKVNRYLFVRTLAILFSLAFFTAQGARQGTDILSANAVLLNFLLLISNGLDGFAHATEALVGKRTGRQDIKGFYRTITTAAIWSLIAALLFTLFFWLFGGTIIRLLTSLENVQQQAMIYLPWLIVLPIISVWSFLLDGIFIGATQVKAMQNTMLFSVFCVFLPIWWLLRPLENHGLWIAFLTLFFARGVSGGWVFWRLSHHQQWQIKRK
ncbi:MATE family efflux transporter [Neptunomonas japonica]|uniref:MATE efflux family protein n=1 Tax=Neptunomonas japonica JAMM 1380 TaxID=1441457 RepID=A0A7R6PF71_9GAMM|nr:MATE family efflux transporter [Neptunomonas japonica]BBB28011.1 MATE efflux family protein [Neptunomonas japonica JAMM 1380]